MTRYAFATEGCAEHFEHDSAIKAARQWARGGLYDAHTVEVSVYDGQREVATFTMQVGKTKRS